MILIYQVHVDWILKHKGPRVRKFLVLGRKGKDEEDLRYLNNTGMSPQQSMAGHRGPAPNAQGTRQALNKYSPNHQLFKLEKKKQLA